ncbi:MAG: response regulator, partial [Thermodesulfovibrionia bacterium]|nr:response regulator [Thermodesulfovibrionia bacterium]
MKILIVDDDPNGLYMLEAILKGYGHEVMAAENGRIALELAKLNPPDLIISDILMPVMDGYKLCHEWKKDGGLKKIPFIFYTASYTDPKDEEYAQSLGTDRFIIKPMEPQKFMKIINEVVKVRKAGESVEPKHPEIANETAILKGHYERMAKKLEDKMAQLEMEITERKRSEERIVHLNAVLQAIRNVNQLITKVKDRERLLQGACDNFIKIGGYNSAWIALIEEGDIGFITAAQAGVCNGFPAMVEGLKRGELTRCMRQAVDQSCVLVVADPAVECGDCPMVGIYAGKARLIARLEHEGRIYGFITVTVSVGMAVDEEERWLFEEIAGDIAFALHNMELEEEHKRADEALRESESRYKHLYSMVRLMCDNLPDLIWTKDLENRFVFANKAYCEKLLNAKDTDEPIGK